MGTFQPSRGARSSPFYNAFLQNVRNPTFRRALHRRHKVGGDQGTRDGLARAAARLPRGEKPKGSVSMATVGGPTGRSHRAQAPSIKPPPPSIKHCLNATVQAADYLDGWIRRYVLEHPLRYRPTEFCADQSQPAKGQKPVPAVSRVSASHTADQSRVNRPPRNRAVFVRDRSVWLSLGHCPRVQYDALAAPVPPHIAALVEQLDTQK